MRFPLRIATGAILLISQAAVAQGPGTANPERPTVATHAYAVAPGYVELEQGLSTRGRRSLSEQTSWDLNLKIGLTRHLQLGLFGLQLFDQAHHIDGVVLKGRVGLGRLLSRGAARG